MGKLDLCDEHNLRWLLGELIASRKQLITYKYERAIEFGHDAYSPALAIAEDVVINRAEKLLGKLS